MHINVVFKVHPMTPTHLMIQIQHQNQIQMQLQIQTLNWPQSQSHSRPVALMGLEVKLEGQVLCGALVHQQPFTNSQP